MNIKNTFFTHGVSSQGWSIWSPIIFTICPVYDCIMRETDDFIATP